jgi:hypothetical protein
MFADGLYELQYRSDLAPGTQSDSLLVALRDGQLLGSDRWGGVFLGRCVFDEGRCRHKFTVQLQVPPGGMLVTDAVPRAGGALIDIELDLLDLEAVAETGSGVVVVAGQPIRIELVYKGTVPA